MMDVTKNINKTPAPPELKLGTYRHYKGDIYEVIGTGMHTETLEFFVVYKPLHERSGSGLWIRPYDMFVGLVDVNGVRVPRFQIIND